MIDKLKKTIHGASILLKEQAVNLGEGAKEKSYKIIEEWLQVFPKLEAYNLKITSFSLGVAISPSVEVELVGKHADFNKERLNEILAENKNSAALLSVFNTIKTTYSFHEKIDAELKDPLIIKIKIRISPEIKVFVGEPIIQ